jgi:iron(III) transport system permease protein
MANQIHRKLLTERKAFAGIAVVVIIFVVALIAYPMGTVLVTAFVHDGTIDVTSFRTLGSIRGISQIVENTAIYAVGSTVLAMSLGSFLAWINERTDARINSLAGILPIVPIMIPPIGSAIGYDLLFAPRFGPGNVFLRTVFGLSTTDGPINIASMTGMIYITGLQLTPLSYLLISAALRNLDSTLDQASRICGAGPFRTFWRVTLPAIAPGIMGAALLTSIAALGSFIVPFIIGGHARITTLPIHIFRLFSNFPPNESQAITLGLCLLAVIYSLVLLQGWITRSQGSALVSSKHSMPTPVKLGWFRWPARVILMTYAFAVLIPLVGLVVTAFKPFDGAPMAAMDISNFRKVFESNEIPRAILHSIAIAAFSATACVSLAFAALYASNTILRRGGKLLDAILLAPSTMPHVVIAIAFILSFGGFPFFLQGSLALIFLAMVLIFIPEASRAVSAALRQVNPELSAASHVAGAGLSRTMRRVVLPQISSGLMAGWVIIFLYAINEVTIASLLGGQSASVIGQVVLDYFQNAGFGVVAALSLLVTAVTATLVFLVRRSLERVAAGL